jgi:hypothetical protein
MYAHVVRTYRHARANGQLHLAHGRTILVVVQQARGDVPLH